MCTVEEDSEDVINCMHLGLSVYTMRGESCNPVECEPNLSFEVTMRYFWHDYNHPLREKTFHLSKTSTGPFLHGFLSAPVNSPP